MKGFILFYFKVPFNFENLEDMAKLQELPGTEDRVPAGSLHTPLKSLRATCLKWDTHHISRLSP